METTDPETFKQMLFLIGIAAFLGLSILYALYSGRKEKAAKAKALQKLDDAPFGGMSNDQRAHELEQLNLK